MSNFSDALAAKKAGDEYGAYRYLQLALHKTPMSEEQWKAAQLQPGQVKGSTGSVEQTGALPTTTYDRNGNVVPVSEPTTGAVGFGMGSRRPAGFDALVSRNSAPTQSPLDLLKAGDTLGAWNANRARIGLPAQTQTEMDAALAAQQPRAEPTGALPSLNDAVALKQAGDDFGAWNALRAAIGKPAGTQEEFAAYQASQAPAITAAAVEQSDALPSAPTTTPSTPSTPSVDPANLFRGVDGNYYQLDAEGSYTPGVNAYDENGRPAATTSMPVTSPVSPQAITGTVARPESTPYRGGYGDWFIDTPEGPVSVAAPAPPSGTALGSIDIGGMKTVYQLPDGGYWYDGQPVDWTPEYVARALKNTQDDFNLRQSQKDAATASQQDTEAALAQAAFTAGLGATGAFGNLTSGLSDVFSGGATAADVIGGAGADTLADYEALTGIDVGAGGGAGGLTAEEIAAATAAGGGTGGALTGLSNTGTVLSAGGALAGAGGAAAALGDPGGSMSAGDGGVTLDQLAKAATIGSTALGVGGALTGVGAEEGEIAPGEDKEGSDWATGVDISGDTGNNTEGLSLDDLAARSGAVKTGLDIVNTGKRYDDQGNEIFDGDVDTGDAGSDWSTGDADISTGGTIADALDRLLKGSATAADLAKLGLTAAGAAALLGDRGDRTSTTKVEYPDWYSDASKSAIRLADQYAALGKDAVAPISANEQAGIDLARTSTGGWQDLLDQSTSALDSAGTNFSEAGALADTVPGYLTRAGGQVDASMPYFTQADTFLDTVPGYLSRAGERADAALPYFTQAGEMADTVSGYLNRSGALADEAAGGIPSVNLSSYMNPYLDNVLAPIARRNELAKAAALNDIKAKAGMRGAFGGSRSTLLEGLTSEAADRNLNEAEANIRSGAFNTALTTAEADLARKLAASGQWGNLGATAGNTANVYRGIGQGVSDSAREFSNMGAVALGGANASTAAGRGVADTANVFNNAANAATSAANARTNIGRGYTDAAGGYRSNAGTFGTLTDADIARLMSTGGTERAVEQARINAPLTAIGGYANALRGNPGATTTATAPAPSVLGQAAGALGALVGANKAGWI